VRIVLADLKLLCMTGGEEREYHVRYWSFHILGASTVQLQSAGLLRRVV
jgi:hypothetical protein